MIFKALEVTVESQGVFQKIMMLDKGMLDDRVMVRSDKKKLSDKLSIVNNQH